MSTQVQRRKGTTVQHSTFTGASAELTVDTTKNTVVVHNGSTAGGFPLAKETGSAISATSLTGPFNGTVGATTTNTGAFTTVSATSTITATGSDSGDVFRGLNSSASNRNDFVIRNAASNMLLGAVVGSIGILAGNAEGMRLTSTGLGIGTTSPLSKLSVQDSWLSSMAGGGGVQDVPVITNYIASTLKRGSINFGVVSGGSTYYSFYVGTTTTPPEVMRIDSGGNLQMQTGAVMPYAPAPAAISAAATLTNANIQGQIISATGTTYTITMPLGTTLETLAKWAAVNVAYDFFVINTATGIITMAVNTGVTSLGSLTIAIGASAHFRIRRTAANTFVLYRLV